MGLAEIQPYVAMALQIFNASSWEILPLIKDLTLCIIPPN